MIERLIEKNNFKIYSVKSEEFNKYGKILKGYNTTSMVEFMKEKSKIPEVGNIYVVSAEELEQTEGYKEFRDGVYGGIDIEIGYCNGNTHMLSALEYHKSPEVNIAITPLVLLLANTKDIKDNRIDSSKVEGFYVEENTCIEIFSSTMHFAPCSVQQNGFKCIVILPRGTNEDIDLKDIKKITLEDELLFKKNKWLLVHKERPDLIEKGAKEGIDGVNYVVKY